ncbi:MAG: PD40 domain-containing protein [Thermoplasmata archaeon]|nr:MAG: PD40 domain-containing protein [Thermoplasmata archaeon]
MKLGKLLFCIVIVSLFLSAAIPMAVSKKPPKPPPPEEPPADPVIAYVGEGGIYVMNADGSNKANVYPYTDHLSYPCWSPDGASIAFIKGGPGGGGPNFEVWAVDVEVVDEEPQGSNERMLADSNAFDGAACRRPEWSPLGDEIAAEGIWFYGNPGVYLFPSSGLPPGGQAEKIYSGEGLDGAGQVAWRSDGSQMAFWFVDRVEDLVVDSWMVILDVTQSPPVVVKTLLQGQFSDFQGIDWARTGDELLFSAKPIGGDKRITYRMNIESGEPVEVVVAGATGGPANAAWSPDDSQMVYSDKYQIKKGKKGTITGILIYDFATEEKTFIGPGHHTDWSRA